MAGQRDEISLALRQRSNIDPQQKERENSMPGPVIPKAIIRLHTFIGHNLFFGNAEKKDRPFREPAFTLYASALNAVWAAAQNDDPYADATLVQIEEQIDKVKIMLNDLLVNLSSLIDSLENAGIQAVSHTSIRPVDVPIAFRTVHAAVSIQLLGLADQVIQKALMARHFGMVTAQDWQRILKSSVSPMRHLFSMSARFRASGATRGDFAANNARAAAAVEKLGQLPQDILEGTRRPKLGPRQSRSLVFTERESTFTATDNSMVGDSLKALQATDTESLQ